MIFFDNSEYMIIRLRTLRYSIPYDLPTESSSDNGLRLQQFVTFQEPLGISSLYVCSDIPSWNNHAVVVFVLIVENAEKYDILWYVL